MGKKVAAVLGLFVTFSLCSMQVSAHTVDDLGTLYDIPILDKTPEEAVKVLKNYDEAKRFIAMYNYVDLSTPDTSAQDAMIQSLEATVKETEQKLLNGYNLTLQQIIELEVLREEALATISYIQRTYDYVQVEVDIPASNEIPTFDEYLAAKQTVAQYTAAKEIGDLAHLAYPLSGDAQIGKHTKVKTTFTCPSLSAVNSLFNGVVTYVDDECVEVTTYDTVVVRYDNLYSVDVEVGDTIYQYKSLGTVYKQLDVSMSINDRYCDITMLYEEAN